MRQKMDEAIMALEAVGIFDMPNFYRVAPQIYIFHIYTRPKFTQIPNLHRTQIYTNPDLHGTHIYTAQIYTNPFPYIDSKKPKFTQPKFTQNPNLHNPTLHITQIYTKLFLQILLKLYKLYKFWVETKLFHVQLHL